MSNHFPTNEFSKLIESKSEAVAVATPLAMWTGIGISSYYGADMESKMVTVLGMQERVIVIASMITVFCLVFYVHERFFARKRRRRPRVVRVKSDFWDRP